jgi:predicted TPR repeat methyltransferase
MTDAPSDLLARGQNLLAAGDLPAAIAEFERAVALDPDFAAARHALGLAWLEAGEPDRAAECLSTLVASPFAADAAVRLELAHAMKAADRSPPGYVRHLFDQFSTGYDSFMLGELNYRAHLILRELADLVLPKRRALDILDLGCGTGLTGAAFAGIARRLDGVDLSPRMIEQASARGIYERLIVADLDSVLAEKGSPYDLILAADTLVYVGDLGPAFRGAAGRLTPGGFFLCTVEHQSHDGYSLGPKRRYRHGEDYLRLEAERSSLEVMALLQCTPREDAKTPVEGLALALQRPRR